VSALRADPKIPAPRGSLRGDQETEVGRAGVIESSQATKAKRSKQR
jgi:hypothetical protein